MSARAPSRRSRGPGGRRGPARLLWLLTVAAGSCLAAEARAQGFGQGTATPGTGTTAPATGTPAFGTPLTSTPTFGTPTSGTPATGTPTTTTPQGAGAPGTNLLQGNTLLQGGPPQPGGGGTSGRLPLLPGATMRERIDAALGLQPATSAIAPVITVTPGIGVEQGWTSNVFNLPGRPAESAFVTILNPSVTVTADSQRIAGALSYAPALNIYEPSHGQDTLAQNLSGQVHTILVPEALFIDLSALATQQTISGGFGPAGALIANRANTAHDYSFSLAPYLQHRFGDWGMAELGGSVGETAQLVPSGTVAPIQPGLPSIAIPSQSVTITEEHLAFRSGEALGRWLTNAIISATQFNGTGVFTGAYQNTVAYEAGYAITRNVTALATIGYDDLHYAGTPKVNIRSVLWNVGAQLTPNADSQITLRYGRKDGIDAAFLAATYMPTARTRLAANYSVTLSTDQQVLRNEMSVASTDAFGNPVNAATGQPLLATSNFFGLVTGVFRLQTASLTGTVLFDRDTLLAGVVYQTQTPLNAPPGEPLVLGQQKGTYGTLSWTHDVSETVKALVSAQYGVSRGTAGQISATSDSFSAYARISYLITPTLTASLQYGHSQITTRRATPGTSADLVLAGLQKTF